MKVHCFIYYFLLLTSLSISTASNCQSLFYKEIEESFGDTEQKAALLKTKGFKLIERKNKSVYDTCYSKYINPITKEVLLYESCIPKYYYAIRYTTDDLESFKRLADQIPRSYTLLSQETEGDWITQSYDSKSYFLFLFQHKHLKGYNLLIKYKLYP